MRRYHFLVPSALIRPILCLYSLIHYRPCSAYAAYIAGILINVVGFAGATGQQVPLAATRIYQMSFFTGFGMSALLYCTLSYAFPPAGAHAVFEETDVSDLEPCDEGLQDTASVDKKEAVYVSSTMAV